MSALDLLRQPGFVVVVSAEEQRSAPVSIDTVRASLPQEGVLRTAGEPWWLNRQETLALRDELQVVATTGTGVAAEVQAAIDLVGYALDQGTGIALVPPLDRG